jgi:hypothetical protein
MPAILSDKPKPTRPVIIVGIPTFGQVSIYWHMQLHDMLTLGKPMNIALTERVVKGHRVDEARNLLVSSIPTVEQELDARVTHVFFVDDDVLVQRDTLIRLFSHRRPIVSGLYYAKTPTRQPLLFMEKNAGPIAEIPQDQLVECYGHGMGCTLIERQVFDAIEAPWFKTDEGSWHGNDFRSHTEDTYFLEKAAAAGFSPCVDTGCEVLHYCAKTDQCYPPNIEQVPA